MTTLETLTAIMNTSSSTEKVRIMRDNLTDTIKDIYEDCYNPSLMYGMSSVEPIDQHPEVRMRIDSNYGYFHASLMDLADRKVTGNAAHTYIGSVIGNYDPSEWWLLCAIVAKDLKIGLSYGTFRSEILGLRKAEFEVTLAQHLEKVKGVNPIDGTWYASRKCDGVRCICFYDTASGNVKFISRQGKEFTTLDNLKPAVREFCSNVPELMEYIGQGLVLDGELCKVDANGDEHFDQIVGECKKKNYTITNCCYQLFDITTEDEFYGYVIPSENFTYRYKLLKRMEGLYCQNVDGWRAADGCWIKVLKQEVLHSQEDFNRWEGYVEKGNWEGFMLRKDVPFEVGRTKNLLKVKKFFDMEFVVKAVEVNENYTYAEAGVGNVTCPAVSNLVVEYKGNDVGVGSGLSKEQRIAWYKDPSLIIGKTVCVKFFEETKDSKTGAYSLRFPTLKHVYENGREV